MRCPMCEGSVLRASHRHGVEVDVCPRCKGIWLDRGELEKVLDALDAQLDEAGATARRPAPSTSPLPPPPAPAPAPTPAPAPADTRPDERPWLSPEVLHGRAWTTKSPPPGFTKGKKPKKHKSALAHLLDEIL